MLGGELTHVAHQFGVGKVAGPRRKNRLRGTGGTMMKCRRMAGGGDAGVSVSVVIVVWRFAETLVQCINSVFLQERVDLDVTIVANGCKKSTLGWLGRYPRIDVIRNRSNMGFAAGCNQGTRASRGDYILFLNSDAWLSSDFVWRIVAALERHPEAASASGMILGADSRTVDSTGIVLNRLKFSPADRDEGRPAMCFSTAKQATFARTSWET